MSLEARTVATPSLDVVKMEDRKRPGGPDDTAPPAKRQALIVNGAKSHQEADIPWKDDIEAYQKDAILRQMREYKRERTTLEANLRDIQKCSQYHDDHLRTIDIWFEQLVDDIKILSGESLVASSQDGSAQAFPPALFYEDSETFSRHLSARKDKILSSLSELFARYPTRSPEVSDLQQQLSRLLAAEKEHICELQRVNLEKEQLSDRLDTATHRYMVAEKKMDRLKSAQVLKLEKQATAGGAVKEEPSSSSSNVNGTESTNGVVNGVTHEEIEIARDQAVAEASKRKEQLEQLEVENKKLTEEITALNVKISGLSDDDYAKTDLFKVLKSQHEDVIKRINNLEATNIQLREEAQKHQAERTAYRIKVDDEARALISESEGNVARAEADLARIRQLRDELLAKVSMLEAGYKNNDASRDQSKELVNACESRIAALESECERLRLQLAEKSAMEGVESLDLNKLEPDQLRTKITTLESQYKLLSNELPAMEAAWKKAQTIAGKKIADIAAWEESVSRANADKSKADQKFFAAMKTKEALDQQIRVLRAQATKGTEVVAQLKDTESASRALVDKLEKQCAEMRAQLEELSMQHRALQQKCNEGAIASEGQISQIAELKKVLEAKDTSYLAAKQAQRESETERDKIAAQVKGLEKQCEHWKKKSLGNQSEETDLLLTMLQCQVCKSQFKDTAIKTCGHTFCNPCVQERLTNRTRKCPHCGKAFGTNDTMHIHL